jgi:hypothetical protein
MQNIWHSKVEDNNGRSHASFHEFVKAKRHRKTGGLVMAGPMNGYLSPKGTGFASFW